MKIVNNILNLLSFLKTNSIMNKLKNSSLLSSIFKYSILSIFQKAVTMFSLPIYIVYINPEEFGKANANIALSGIFILIATFALDETFVRFYFEYKNDEQKLKEKLSSIIFISMIISFFVIVILYYNRYYIWSKLISDYDEKIFIYILVIIFTTPFIGIYQKYLRIMEKIKEYSKISMSIAFMQMASTLILLIIFKLKSEAIVIGQMIPSVIMYIYSCIKLITRFGISLKIDSVKEILKYCIPIVPYNLAAWGLTSFTLIYLGKTKTNFEVGILNAMNYYAIIINVLGIAVVNAWQPWIYKKMEKGKDEYKDIQIVSRNMCVIFTIIGLFVSIYSRDISILIIDKKYHQGILLIPMLTFNSVFLIYGSLSIFVIYFNKKYVKYALFSTVFGSMANIIMSLLLIKKYSIFGAVIAMMVANIIVSLIKQIIASRLIKIDLIFIDFYLYSLFTIIISTILTYYVAGILIKIIITIVMLFIIFHINSDNIKYSIDKLTKSEI